MIEVHLKKQLSTIKIIKVENLIYFFFNYEALRMDVVMTRNRFHLISLVHFLFQLCYYSLTNQHFFNYL